MRHVQGRGQCSLPALHSGLPLLKANMVAQIDIDLSLAWVSPRTPLSGMRPAVGLEPTSSPFSAGARSICVKRQRSTGKSS